MNIDILNANRTERLKEMRSTHKLSLEAVGNIVGLRKTTIRKWELGQISNLKPEHLTKLANYYHVNPAWLSGYDAPMFVDSEEIYTLRKQIIDSIRIMPAKKLSKVAMMMELLKDEEL